MKKVKLCQIVAVEKDTRAEASEMTRKLRQISDHPELFEGFLKEWEPLSDDGERFQPERKAVQYRCREVLREALDANAEDISVEATKDYGNARAAADVVVDGQTVIQGAPVPFLLFLEKRLSDLHSAVSGLPERDTARLWTEEGTLARSDTVRTHRTRKTQKPIVLYDATAEHPAQTQLVTEDVIVGHWMSTLQSGAFGEDEKKDILGRITKLKNAVKFAREEANSAVVDRLTLGGEVTRFILGE